MKPISINVPVPVEMKTVLIKEAEREDLTVAQLVRRILKKHIETHPTVAVPSEHLPPTRIPSAFPKVA